MTTSRLPLHFTSVRERIVRNRIYSTLAEPSLLADARQSRFMTFRRSLTRSPLRRDHVDPLEIFEEVDCHFQRQPDGAHVSLFEYFESRLSDYLEGFFRKLGVEYQRIEVLPGRANVVARLDRPGSAVTVLLDAHQDTVPVEGMTIEPFQPRRQGRTACQPQRLRRQGGPGGDSRRLRAARCRSPEPCGERRRVVHLR